MGLGICKFAKYPGQFFWSERPGTRVYECFSEGSGPCVRKYIGCFFKCRVLDCTSECWIGTLPGWFWCIYPLRTTELNKQGQTLIHTKACAWSHYAWSVPVILPGVSQESLCWWQQLAEKGWIKTCSRTCPETPTTLKWQILIQLNEVKLCHRGSEIGANAETTGICFLVFREIQRACGCKLLGPALLNRAGIWPEKNAVYI